MKEKREKTLLFEFTLVGVNGEIWDDCPPRIELWKL